MQRFLTEARGWAAGRWWHWRLPLLLFLAWDGLRQLTDPEAQGLFGGITFGVHEFGHLLFAFLGEFMAIAGGSLSQLLLPVLTGLLLYHHRDFFGLTVAGAWLSSSLAHLARYIADARSADLDLVSFGEDAIHDWSWLLGRFGALQHDLALAGAVRLAAVVVLVTALGFGIWLCLAMAGRVRHAGEP